MIQLDELHIWEKLSGPYGNSEEIPALLTQLGNTHSKKIADEIIWEYIYHQGSIYECTLATIPHLLKIADESNNPNFKLDLLLSLGIVLIGIDETSNLQGIFKEENLAESIQKRIQTAFIDSLQLFKDGINHSFQHARSLEEESKRFFLIAFLVISKKHKEAEIFTIFSGNDEYVFVCPHCEEETFLWNEENILNAYSKDPVLSTESPQKLSIEINESNPDLEWLETPVNEIGIHSLKPLIKYFRGDLTCHNCNKQSNVFAGILNSV